MPALAGPAVPDQLRFNRRFDDVAKEIDMFPRDLIDETIEAFSVNATSATGYACVIQFVSRFNW